MPSSYRLDNNRVKFVCFRLLEKEAITGLPFFRSMYNNRSQLGQLGISPSAFSLYYVLVLRSTFLGTVLLGFLFNLMLCKGKVCMRDK